MWVTFPTPKRTLYGADGNARPKDKPYKMADGEGLLIWVQPSGAKWWRLRYRFGGKEKMLSLGVFPAVSLKDARKARDDARTLLTGGIDPATARKVEAALVAEDGDTFERVALAWWQQWKGSCTSGHADNTLKRLKADVFPFIGHVPVKKLTAPMLLAMAKRIESRGGR